MVSVLNLMTVTALLIFGVGLLLFGLAAPINSNDLFNQGMVWVLFVSTVWTLSLYSIHLAEVGARAVNGFMKNSWILGFIGLLLTFVGILVLLFGGILITMNGALNTATAAGLVLMGLGPVMTLLLPGIAKMIARDEIGMPAIGLVAEIFAIIFSVLFLVSLILLAAASADGFKWVMLIAGICGLGFAVMETVSLFLYRTFAPSRR
jgi:hypothetical protein